MAGMLRHNSGSVISSLQSYGDSDDEENDLKNETNVEPPFSSQSEENISQTKEENSSQQKQSPTPSPNPSDKGITFSADPSQSQRLENDSADSNSRLEEPETKEPSPAPNTRNDMVQPEVSPAELISDDEGEHGQAQSTTSKTDLKEAVVEALNVDSPSSQGSTKPGRQAQRLVSYGPDEDLDEDETSSEEDNEESENNSPEAISTDNSVLSRSVRNMSSDEIQIPPEPPGKCSAALQKKIEDSFERMRREGLDLNRIIQSKKHFRNPSIYEKLIDFCHIDEKGTNFPPELYDPHIWGKESFHDELDKAQRKDMERREKEKKEKTKIEFLTGTKKSGSENSSSGQPDEKRRKTKWDAQPSGLNIHVAKLPSAQQNPGVVNLTAMATGTKNTIIPAVGSLSKKSSSGK